MTGYISKAKHDNYATPPDLLKRLTNNQPFVDFCPFNYKIDALTIDWTKEANGKLVYLNPAYSKLKQFSKKIKLEAEKGCRIVALVPMRCSNKYWKENIDSTVNYIVPHQRICFISQTDGIQKPAPFNVCSLWFNIKPHFNQFYIVNEIPKRNT